MTVGSTVVDYNVTHLSLVIINSNFVVKYAINESMEKLCSK